ncbi:hypothetical protein C8Q80DRAFT_1139662 [Daedaleopsis nitida]|nr:hypothetical protein C8Q80DRAFT_1139662 [Daedaleopsis nitida]
MSNSPTLNVALQASSCTTPRKTTSGQVSASGLPKAPRSQQTPLDAMPLELGDQVWEFDVKTTRSMLSPKRLRSDVNKKDPYPPLDSSACFVDDPEAQQAMKSMPQPDVLSGWDPDESDEKVSYKPTATFLNNCVDNCYDALAKLRQSHEDFRDCWWPTLKFFVYDKETKDGMEGSASPLKPHLVGVASGEAGNDPGASGILLPVEVQKNWTEIIKQAATYARAMVSAALRLFSVVIGVNHEMETLWFLIYHRGGLTMSHEISLQEPQGRHNDAGFPSFTTGTISLLPSRDKDKPVTLITNKVLFKSLSIRGRGTYVLWATIAHRPHTLSCDAPVDEEASVNDKCTEPWRHQSYTPCYTPPSNFIGTPARSLIKYSFPDSAKRGIETHVHDSPTHLCTFEACRSDGGAFSNSFLLPSDGSFEEHRWRHALASSRRLPDRRTLQVIVTVEKGASLEHCKSAAELFKCVLHAQIGGSHNYLHHDVSIGNVLQLDSPAHRPTSSIRKQLLKSTPSSPDIVEHVKNLSLDSQHPDGDDQSWTTFAELPKKNPRAWWTSSVLPRDSRKRFPWSGCQRNACPCSSIVTWPLRWKVTSVIPRTGASSL